MFANLGAMQKMNILNCLVGEYYQTDQPIYDKFHAIDEKIDSLREIRNNLQHCVLEESEEGTLDYIKFLTKGRWRGNRGIREKSIEICAEDAEDCASEIIQVSRELSDFVNACAPGDVELGAT